MLRKRGVVGKFVEFFGPGVGSLTLADRATVSNMAPEYGATMGFFPVDHQTLHYLRTTGRTEEHIKLVEKYLRAQNLFLDDVNWGENVKWSDLLTLDLGSVSPCVAGPKRPQDRVDVKNLKA
jgi:aconitate hydratase